MTRTRSHSAALVPVLLLALACLLGSAGSASAAGDGGDAPDWCFRANTDGEMPTCTWDGQRWHRSYEGGSGLEGSAGGAGDGFAGLLVIGVLAGIAITVWKVSTARRMARDSGMDPGDATTMTLLTDDGFEAAYLAANLRGKTAPPVAPPASPGVATPSVAERLRQLQELRDQDLITPGEYDARRATIIDSV